MQTDRMLELQVVDAFTDRPFSGNPAAVSVLDAFPSDEWLQLVAREMNLSETSFVVPRRDGAYDLRWFTPATEVDLCGHATLASAHVLGGAARFHTRSGWLTCSSPQPGRIAMDFPSDPLTATSIPMDLPSSYVGRGRADLLVDVGDAVWLRSYVPDLTSIAALDARGLILTAPGDAEGIDFISRFFAPGVGIPEDPVTGSAHCTLAGYWADRTGRRALTGYQASARGGTVGIRVSHDRVELTGSAVTVSEVRMNVDIP